MSFQLRFFSSFFLKTVSLFLMEKLFVGVNWNEKGLTSVWRGGVFFLLLHCDKFLINFSPHIFAILLPKGAKWSTFSPRFIYKIAITNVIILSSYLVFTELKIEKKKVQNENLTCKSTTSIPRLLFLPFELIFSKIY